MNRPEWAGFSLVSPSRWRDLPTRRARNPEVQCSPLWRSKNEDGRDSDRPPRERSVEQPERWAQSGPYRIRGEDPLGDAPDRAVPYRIGRSGDPRDSAIYSEE